MGATVKAIQTSQVRILHREVFMKTLEEHSESLQLESMSKVLTQWNVKDGNECRITRTARRLSEVDTFKQLGCSPQFLEFLSTSLEERIYLSGQKICVENSTDDSSAYILTRGKARVVAGGNLLGELSDGSVFGEQVLFGLCEKRAATVIAATTCQTQVLYQSVVIKGLELFPEERQKVLMIAFKMQADSEGDAKSRQSLTNAEDWKSVELRAVMKAVKSSPVLGNMSGAFVEELSTVADNRIYMPGDLIIEEGKEGDSMFIMVSGNAAVFTTTDSHQHTHATATGGYSIAGRKSKRIGVLSAGSISGELAMLGVSKVRSATIEAETICCMWEISHDSALSIIDRMPDVREQFADIIVQHLQHTVPPCIDALQLFKNFDRKFRMLLGLYCDKHALFPGQPIFQEGQVGEGLYVLNQGRGQLERKQITIKTYTSGSYFNSTIMLGIHQTAFCTLIAIQTCHVVVISRASFIQALEHYPSHQSAMKLLRQEVAQHEEFKEQIQRLVMRSAIWKRAMHAQGGRDSRELDPGHVIALVV